METKKLVELTVTEKVDLLAELDAGMSQRKLAAKYNVSKSTVGNIKSQRSRIMLAFQENDNLKRKLKQTQFLGINKAVYTFFVKCRAANIPVSGRILQAKAKKISEALNIDNFTASNGWLDSFRKRHNIEFKILSGEAATANHQTANDWKAKLPQSCDDVIIVDHATDHLPIALCEDEVNQIHHMENENVHEVISGNIDEVLNDVVCEIVNASEISDTDSEVSVESIEQPTISQEQALKHLNDLIRFSMEQLPDATTHLMKFKSTLETKIAKSKAYKQTNLKDFFK